MKQLPTCFLREAVRRCGSAGASVAVLGLLLVIGMPSSAATVSDIRTGTSTFLITSDTTGEAGGGLPKPAPIVTTLGTNWVTVAGTSWIGPDPNQSSNFRGNGFGGTTVYTTTFDLTGFSAASAAIAATFTGDDVVTILLNGNSIFNSSPANLWTTIVTLPSVGSGNFIAGLNTLTFTVVNSGNGATGLDGRFVVTADPSGVPETGLVVPFTAALLVGAAVMFRRRENLFNL